MREKTDKRRDWIIEDQPYTGVVPRRYKLDEVY